MIEFREHERKILLHLRELGGKASLELIARNSVLPDATIMRAALTLQQKGVLRITERSLTFVELTNEGKTYAKFGLPERRLFDTVRSMNGTISFPEAISKAGIDKKFVPITLGWVQKKNWLRLDPKTKTLKILDEVGIEGDDEKLLKILYSSKETAMLSELSSNLQKSVQILKRRKLLETREKVERTLEITDIQALNLVKKRDSLPEVTQLTPEIIVSGKWRKTKLQKYDIHAPVAKTWPGKKHPYLQFLDEVKDKLVNMGFKEMTGPMVEISFFNFDSLYVPQGHPAREPAGIYFVKKPRKGSLSAYRRQLRNVKETHETGWKTRSKGWGYDFSLEEAKRLVLRGHGTAISARMLTSNETVTPSKYFSIARCFRPEVPDKTHLQEFNQVEGIIVDESLTLRDLLGVLETFALEIAGAEKVQFKPDYFPFTEPSVEISAYKKDLGWIEFGGSGIFRYEVTKPLGIQTPVIAWGLGVDRLYMMKANIKEISQIFTQDLNWIRTRTVT